MQEFVAEPWSTKTYSLQSWVSRANRNRFLPHTCTSMLYAACRFCVAVCPSERRATLSGGWRLGLRSLRKKDSASSRSLVDTAAVPVCAVLCVLQGVRAVGGLLRRLSVELFWRGLVVAGLAGWLYSSWETGGGQYNTHDSITCAEPHVHGTTTFSLVLTPSHSPVLSCHRVPSLS